MPVNENCHLFNEIIKKKNADSGIFNLDGQFGFSNKVIATFDDLSLINYFGLDVLNEFVPEGHSRILHYNKSRQLVQIIPEEIYDINKIRNNLNNIQKGNLVKLTVPKRKSNIEKAVCLAQIPSGDLIFANKTDYKYLRNISKNDSSFYLTRINGFYDPIVAAISPKTEKVYGMIVSLLIK